MSIKPLKKITFFSFHILMPRPIPYQNNLLILHKIVYHKHSITINLTNNMKKVLLSLSFLLVGTGTPCYLTAATKTKLKNKVTTTTRKIMPMKEYIDELMAKMTLQEKIGQLNLMVAGDITTGGAMDTQVGGDIAGGNIGGIFNIKGFDKIKALQDIAIKKSRLGIPLLVGMDVIHGYETIFPIPLALSCS